MVSQTLTEPTEPTSKSLELEKDLGVSIIVCCHNSSELLPATLQHLKAQEAAGVPWEAVLVDNASTDNTANIAKEIWESSVSPARLRIVSEPQLGLAFARQRGIAEASYEFLCFIDDDNWVDPNWVRNVRDVMRDHPEVGACGGLSQAEFGGPPPRWFTEYSYLYAVMPESKHSGNVSNSRLLWGAGLTLRRSALARLSELGFESVLVGRTGKQLSSGEDTELCLALRMAGWSLWLEPRLHFIHYLPSRRLEWNYLRRLAFGSAFATPAHDALYFVRKPPRRGLLRVVRAARESWLWQVLSSVAAMLMRPLSLLSSLLLPTAGDPGVIQTEFQKGRFMGLIAAFPWYGGRRRALRRSCARALRTAEPIVEGSS